MTVNALNVYVSTCRLALLATASLTNESSDGDVTVSPLIAESSTTNGGSPGTSRLEDGPWAELYRMLPCLRRALACGNCGQLAADPVGVVPDDTDPVTTSDHPAFSCRQCAGRRLSGDTTPALAEGRILVKCYRKLCQYLSSTSFRRKFGGLSANGGVRTLADLIHEGANLKEEEGDQSGTSGTRPAFSNMIRIPTNGIDVGRIQGRSLARPLVPTRPGSGKANGATIRSGNAPRSASNLYSVSSNHSTRITIKRKRQTAASRPAVSEPSSSTVPASPAYSPSTSTSSSSSPDDEPLATVTPRRPVAALKKRKVGVETDGRRRRARSDKSQQPSQSERRRNNTRDIQSGKKAAAGRASNRPCQCGASNSGTGSSGKMTCRGRRCHCFAAGRQCVGCGCRGCRNPCRSGGRSKVDYAETATTSGSETTESSSSSSSSSFSD